MLASKLQGSIRLELLSTGRCPARRVALSCASAVSCRGARGGNVRAREPPTGATFVGGDPVPRLRRSSRSAAGRTSPRRSTRSTARRCARASSPGVIGVIVGLLLAQLIALRLRRLTAAAEAIAQGDFETPLRYRFRDEFGRARAELRPDAPPAAPLASAASRPSATGCALLLERLHEGVAHDRPGPRRPLREHRGAPDARRAPRRRETRCPSRGRASRCASSPQGLFDERATLAQVHVRPDEQRALRRRRHPVPARDRLGADRRRRPDRAGAARARRARVRLERGARAAHAADDDHRRRRGASGRARRRIPSSATASSRHIEREAGTARAARTRAADAGARARRAGAAARRRRSSSLRSCARSPPTSSPHAGVAVDVEVRERPRGRGEPRPARAGAAQPRRERREAHARAARSSCAPTARATRSRSRSRTRAPGSAPRCSGMSSTASTAASATPTASGSGSRSCGESVRTLGGRIELDSSPGEGTRLPDPARAGAGARGGAAA